MAAKVWELTKGRWGGITAKGKRIKIVKSKKAARKLAGLASKSRTTKSKTSTSKKRTGSKRKLTKKRKRGKRKFTIPIAPLAGLIASPALRSAVTDAIAGNFDGAMKNAGQIIGFWDGKFYIEKLVENVGPMILGCLVHKFVGGPPLNLNRMLASANVPFIRI